MVRSVEVIRLGSTRRGVRVLSPGTYSLCTNNEYIVLNTRCSFEVTETFQKTAGAYPDSEATLSPTWKVTAYHHDTLRAMPSLWQRMKATLLGREPPVPRAVTVVRR